MQGVVHVVARSKPCGRHVVSRHEHLREGLARFEFSGRLGWTEQQSVLSREAIGHACAQRHFRPDDGEIDSFGVSNSGEIVRTGQIRGNGPSQLSNTRIAGGTDNFWRIGIADSLATSACSLAPPPITKTLIFAMI